MSSHFTVIHRFNLIAHESGEIESKKKKKKYWFWIHFPTFHSDKMNFVFNKYATATIIATVIQNVWLLIGALFYSNYKYFFNDLIKLSPFWAEKKCVKLRLTWPKFNAEHTSFRLLYEASTLTKCRWQQQCQHNRHTK